MDQFNACGMPQITEQVCVPLLRLYRVRIALADGELNPDIQQVIPKAFALRGFILPRPDLVPDITVRLRTFDNYYLSNQRFPLRLLAQNGIACRALNRQLMIPAGESISLEAENQSGAAVDTYLVLAGVDLEAS